MAGLYAADGSYNVTAVDGTSFYGIYSGDGSYNVTVLNSQALDDMSTTWNDGGTTFTAIKMDVTNTASAAASLLMDLQVGGSSLFNVTKAGAVRATSGSAAAPTFSFSNATNTGIFNTVSILELASAGVLTARFSGGNWFNPVGSGAVIISAAGSYNWSSNIAGTDGSDVCLFRDAANTLALRNGTNAQTFRVYRTYTDASNYERILAGWSGTSAFYVTENAGTGVARDLVIGTSGAANLNLRTDNTNRWRVQTSTGAFVAIADNTYDIGASGATRPRSIYAGTNISAGGFISASASVRATTEMWLGDNISAPSATVGYAKLYVDSADGDLKVIFGDGTIKTLATDT